MLIQMREFRNQPSYLACEHVWRADCYLPFIVHMQVEQPSAQIRIQYTVAVRKSLYQRR